MGDFIKWAILIFPKSPIFWESAIRTVQKMNRRFASAILQSLKNRRFSESNRFESCDPQHYCKLLKMEKYTQLCLL